jgi:DNA repair protein RecO (recombination protein O)
MSTIVTTDAIVLKSMKYRETSKIVAFYTHKFGKISAIVKGARRSKSKYGSSLEPMSYVSVVIYKKEGRELQTVSQCDVIKPFRHLTDDLDKIAVGLSVIELVSIVAHEEEENIPLFNLVIDTLTALNDAKRNPSNLFYSFQMHLAQVLGFQPIFDRCISCGSDILSTASINESIEYHLDKGGPLCVNCSNVPGHRTKLSPKVFNILERIASTSTFDSMQNLEIDKKSRNEIESFLWSYLQYHVTGFRALKSTKVFSRILLLP